MSNLSIVNLLSEHLDALIGGTLEREKLLAKYNIARNNPIVELMDIAERLEASMSTVKPSEQFVAELYDELVGPSSTTFWGRWARHQMDRLPNLPVDVQPLERWRQLPFRVQLAAAGLGGLTLFIIAARRTVHKHDIDEEAADTYKANTA